MIKTVKNTGEFVEFDPHLILMDISLPFFNGYHWCSEIRKVSKVPIIFISSASDNFNIVMAVNMGGDDFIAKPFDLEVLTAKVQAMLRRTYDFSGQTGLLEHKGVVLNTNDASLTYQDEKVELTKNDYRILQVLMENKGKIVTRDTLMQKLWETDSYVDEKWLLFVIEQILFNALKYTNEGKISIYMERNSVLVIEDTGIGIQSEDLPRVFEKGFTGYNGRNDKKSTGLGLYLCKRILTKLSHEINIESQVGKGTKVMIGLNQEHRIFE